MGGVTVVSTSTSSPENSDYRRDQALEFLKDHLYGDRQERIPGQEK